MPRSLMLENEEIVDLFKKSLSATIKSIGKSGNIEINFVDKNPSINGDQVNLDKQKLFSDIFFRPNGAFSKCSRSAPCRFLACDGIHLLTDICEAV